MPNESIDPTTYLRQAYERTRSTAICLAKTQEFGGFRSVGIVGAGIMGASIAAVHLERQIPVVLVDSRPEALERAKSELVKDISSQAIDKLFRRTVDLADLAHCDLVIESIVEKSVAKQTLLSEIESVVSIDTVIASNTSTIPIGRLAKALKRADRFCGIHFCHPVRDRPLVEVIAGPATSGAVSKKAVCHLASLDRLPIVVADGHGFVVNRLLLPYLGEGMALLADGVPAKQIDQAAREFGMSSGPLEMLDGIGLDTALYGGLIMSEVAAERMADMGLLVALVKAGDLGEKAGAGIYKYPSLELSRRASNLLNGRFKPAANVTYEPQQLRNRLMFPMLLEAVRIAEDRKVDDIAAIDLAAVYGLGFPAARGGPLAWADEIGAKRIIALLAELPELGQRGRPPELLAAMATDGRTFREMQA